MNAIRVRTARLELVAATLELLQAEQAGLESLAAALGARVPSTWPSCEYDSVALESFTMHMALTGGSALGWFSWYVVAVGSQGRREALIGQGGYMGPPAQGLVEIGYAVIPEARHRGYATEFVDALTVHALSFCAVDRVIAHTLQSNEGSARVLRRCGFECAGPGPEADTLRFERLHTDVVSGSVATSQPRSAAGRE